ncbi:MAG: hypothetical protein Q9212_006921 [Teloschistes hypoglaucus]
MALCLKAIIAPEFIAVKGLQEWSQARRMVKDCHDLNQGRLKLTHAFYVGMLALRYRTPRGEKIIWPNQYTWLLQRGLVDWQDDAEWALSEDTICDKSNADGTAKLLALGQVSWFAAQCIMRRAHALPLSQLESMTLSYIPLFAITYLFWWLKPKDVLTPSIIHLPNMSEEQKNKFESMAVSDVFDNEGIGKQRSIWTIWYLTPRVFEKEAKDKAQEQEMEQNPIRTIRRAENLEAKMTTDLLEAGNLPAKEIVVAHWDPELYRSNALWPVTCLFGASFGALHLIAWDTEFPTHIEQWLWRGAALATTVSLLIFMQFEKVVLRWGGPLTLISLISPVVYLLSRLIMMGGVVAAFRASDPKIYDTYVVSTYWIHVL